MAGERTEIGKMFARYRVDHDLSGQQFAEIVGVAPAMVSRVERGHDPMPPAWLSNIPEEMVVPVAKQLREEQIEKHRAIMAEIDKQVQDRRNVAVAAPSHSEAKDV